MRVCSIDGCDGVLYARGWCTKHWKRWRKHGDPLLGRDHALYVGETCSIDGCDQPARTRALCNKHYLRWRKWGDPLISSWEQQPKYSTDDRCVVDGCDEQPRTKRMCFKHYQRVIKYGDSSVVRSTPTGRDNPAYRELVGYQQAHIRVRNARGPARDHPCTDCGQPAKDWSFCHKTAAVIQWWTDHKGSLLPYSSNIDDYAPRCQRCHALYDDRQPPAPRRRQDAADSSA